MAGKAFLQGILFLIYTMATAASSSPETEAPTRLPIFTASVAPTTSTTPTTSIVSTTSTTSSVAPISTGMDNGAAQLPMTPTDSSLIQILFPDLSSRLQLDLNDSSSMSDQVFANLPNGIAYGLRTGLADVLSSNFSMLQSVRIDQANGTDQPFVAIFFIFDWWLEPLQGLVSDPSSRLYSNPDSEIHSLMLGIEKSFPILPGAPWFNPTCLPADDSPESSNPTKDVTPSIVAGVLGGILLVAIGFGAWMFFRLRSRSQLRRFKDHKKSPRESDEFGSYHDRDSATTPSPHLNHSARRIGSHRSPETRQGNERQSTRAPPYRSDSNVPAEAPENSSHIPYSPTYRELSASDSVRELSSEYRSTRQSLQQNMSLDYR